VTESGQATAPSPAKRGRPKQVVLAAPRGYCAGVDRAVITVEKALDTYGPPVYVRKQIVHNRHVVEDLEDRGAIFVAELDEVPEGSTVVFSAPSTERAYRSTTSRARAGPSATRDAALSALRSRPMTPAARRPCGWALPVLTRAVPTRT